MHLLSGAALIALLAWLFGLVAEDVVDGSALAVVDEPLALWCHHHASQPLLGVMWAFTVAGSITSISLLASLTAVRMRRDRYWLLALVVAVPGGMLLGVVLKHLFHRARPHFDDPFLTLSTYSFPSGHALGSTLLVGYWCILALSRSRSLEGRSAVACASVLIVLAVAFSRVYLGAHFLTDVIGGITIGMAWLTVTFTGISALYHRRHPTRRLLTSPT